MSTRWAVSQCHNIRAYGAPIYTYSGEPDLGVYARAAAPSKVSVQHLVRPGLTDADNPHHFVVVTLDRDRLSLRVVATAVAPFRPFGTETLSLRLESRETVVRP